MKKNMPRWAKPPPLATAQAAAKVNELASRVAAACGYERVPQVVLTRGEGAVWFPTRGHIAVGTGLVRRGGDRLWEVLAHELCHAQAADRKEGHRRSFYQRLAEGLRNAGKLELLRQEFGYKEAALIVARAYGLRDVPHRQRFHLARGDTVVDGRGAQWKVTKRFRRGGEPWYRLRRPGWRWVAPQEDIPLASRNGR